MNEKNMVQLGNGGNRLILLSFLALEPDFD